jgi:hypothetical protein
MARQLYQLSAVQGAFAARIRAKVQDRRTQAQEHTEDIPLLNWLLKPLAGLAFDAREGRNTRRGEHGEEEALGTLLRWLPDSWVVFHNVVVEPQPDDFAQIDLLIVGTAGVFLVETKAWRGSYQGYRDAWQQREEQTWAKVSSPTAQVQRQARMLAWWLEQQRSLVVPPGFQRCMVPLVVFTQAQWLRVTQCSVEVFDGVRPLLQHIKAYPDGLLANNQVEAICDLIIRSPTPVLPLPAPAANAPQRPAPSTLTPPTSLPAPGAPPSEAPRCRRCGVSMVLRTARQGANAGNQFYGCPNFPRCREVQPIGEAKA